MPEQKAFLAPDVILRYLIKEDEDVEKLLDLAEEGKVDLVTSDFAIYEAISSLKEKVNKEKLCRLFYLVEIIPSPKIKIDESRIEHLRDVAFGRYGEAA